MKLTADLSQALTNLRANGDFQLFLAALKEDEATETTKALSTDGVHCHRAQGVALYLRSVLEGYAQAPAVLEKFKTNTKREYT